MNIQNVLTKAAQHKSMMKPAFSRQVATPPGQFITLQSFNVLCCDMDQRDTIGKIELIPFSVLSTDNTNCKNDIQ